MAENLTVAQVMTDLAPSRFQGRSVVKVSVTGATSSAGDTSAAFSVPGIGDVEHVECHGPLTYTKSGNTVTFRDEVGISTRVCSATIYGKVGR